MAKNDWPKELEDELIKLATGRMSAREIMGELRPMAVRLNLPSWTKNAVLGKVGRYNKKIKEWNDANPPEKHRALLKLTETKKSKGTKKADAPKKFKPSRPVADKKTTPKNQLIADTTPRNQTELSVLFDKSSARLPGEIVREEAECPWPTANGSCGARKFISPSYKGGYCCIHFALSVSPKDPSRLFDKHPGLKDELNARMKALEELRNPTPAIPAA